MCGLLPSTSDNVLGRTLDYLESPFLNIFLHIIPSQLHLRNRTLLKILPCLKSSANITPIILTSFFFISYMSLMIIDLLICERESACISGRGAEGEKGREYLKQTSCLVWTGCQAQSHDLGIIIWAKIKSLTLNWLSHPGTPLMFFFSNREDSIIHTIKFFYHNLPISFFFLPSFYVNSS